MLKKKIYYILPHDVRRLIFSKQHKARYQRYQTLRQTLTPEGYSFKPFDAHQCIFVHIPKAAGVSVCKTLFGNLSGGHTTIAEYQMAFSRREFKRYFKFSFVRNPWDRLFSAYNFLKKGGMDQEDRQWAAANLDGCGGFNEFVSKRLCTTRVRKYIHFKPQHEFLCVPHRHKPLVDYVGYFENIREDFEYVKKRLGLGNDVRLSHENKTVSSGQGDYRSHYSSASRQIVAQIYKQDIELWGYGFDSLTPLAS